MPEDKLELAVNAIIHDLSWRKGIGDEWDQIDEDYSERDSRNVAISDRDDIRSLT